MIHPYNKIYLSIIMRKLAGMFQLAVMEEHMDIDDFVSKFISSGMAYSFEIANPEYVLGKSENELVGIILQKEPLDVEQHICATPFFWVGWVLKYAQWSLNRTYKEITDAFPCSKLQMYYFPYHEMDITKSLDLIKKMISYVCPLKDYRLKKGYSQKDLAEYSDVSVRNIKAYEQGTVDIAKASGRHCTAL